MNIFDFIDSVAISEHLQKINYKFSATEKAFLIFHSEWRGLKEKHAAYEELIRTETDTKIEKRPNTREYPSLFLLLRRYMEIENKLISEFYDTGDAVFRYKYLCGDDESFCEDYETVFPTLADCEAAFREDIEDYGRDPGMRYYVMRMDSLVNVGQNIEIRFSPCGDILTVSANMIDEETFDVLSAFDGMWFDFPTPFKRGDVIIEEPRFGFSKPKAPLVVTSVSSWNKADYLENGYTERDSELEHCDKIYNVMKENGDFSDMTVRGYYGYDDGTFYYEVGHNLMSHEYYTEPLEGGYRVLKVISDFERGELSLDSVVKLARHIADEERLKREERYIHLNDDYLRSLGIT